MQTKVLLSIKPEFAHKIFDGVKRFEFRKRIFKESTVRKVVIYASAPERKVLGEFEIENIIYEKIDMLWEITQRYAGISKCYFQKYFSDRREGYAIKIKNSKKYAYPISLDKIYQSPPPQSFAYLN